MAIVSRMSLSSNRLQAIHHGNFTKQDHPIHFGAIRRKLRGSLVRLVLPQGKKVCLIQYHAKNEWLLAKGRRNCGESRREATLRELREETGYSAYLHPVTMLLVRLRGTDKDTYLTNLARTRILPSRSWSPCGSWVGTVPTTSRSSGGILLLWMKGLPGLLGRQRSSLVPSSFPWSRQCRS